VLYNRCSARPDGTPWSERKKLVWWDAATSTWTGDDVPDFPLHLAPDAVGRPDGDAMERLGGTDAFLAKTDGKAWLFAPSALRDGPLPAHYEPLEGGVRNPLHRQQSNPARAEWRRRENPYHDPYDDPRYPVILSTNRLTEMYGAGVMSRWLPWLAELQPAAFVELAPAHARELGIGNGDWVTIRTARAAIEVRALVTERIAPLQIGGRMLHHVGLNYHFGRKGLVTGEPTNELIAIAAEPNVTIQGSKVLSVAIEAGRHGGGWRALTGQAGATATEAGATSAAEQGARRSGDLPGAGPQVEGEHGYVGGRSRAFGFATRRRR
jgi:formate dehydrogenase major subunit